MERENRESNKMEAALQARLSRRRLLGATGALAAVPFVGFGEAELQKNYQRSIPDQQTPVLPENPFLVEEEHGSEHESSLVNDLTAYGITAAFASLVSAVATERATFDIRTAAGMTGLGAARAAALFATDKEGFDHEMNEHFGKPSMPGGYPLLPLLVGLAESASHVKAENDEVFRGRDVAETLASELQESGNLFEKRPEEGASKEEWVKYYLTFKNRVITAAARSAALTSVLAPIGTTYTSAAVANENFKKMLPLLEEAHYAKRVVQAKDEGARKGDEVIYPDEIERWQTESREKALDDINGRDGYVHLNIALSTNLNGALLIGDPPLIYFALRHPKLYAEASALGLAASEIATLAENYVWIARSLGKEDAQKFFTQFVGSQLTTLQALRKSLTNGELRDVSFGGAKNVTQRFMDKLDTLRSEGSVTEDAANVLRDQLQHVPEPMFYFDVPSLIENKINNLQRMLATKGKREDHKKTVDIEDYGYFGYREFESLLESDRFLSAFKSEDAKTRVDLLRSLRNALKHEKGNDAVALLGSLLTEDPRNAPEVETVVAQLLDLPISRTKLTARIAQNEIAKRIPEIEDVHLSKNLQGRINLMIEDAPTAGLYELKVRLSIVRDDALEIQGNGYADLLRSQVDTLLEDFDTLGKEEVIERLQDLSSNAQLLYESRKDADYKKDMTELFNTLSALAPSDIKLAMENAFRLSEDEEPEHDENRFLGHQAREVRDVLLTQLPAVPSLIHTVNKVLPKIIGVGEEGPNADQLQQMTWAILASTAITSAFADNVAAYLFGENVLDQLYEEYYGDEYSDGLKKAVYLSALMTSVVAGSLSKIGNGPNVTLSRIGEDGQEIPLTLGSTLGNPYAIAQTVALTTLANFNIERVKPENKE